MIIVKIIAVLLGSILASITLGFACLGASYFFECVKEYEEESKHFMNEK